MSLSSNLESLSGIIERITFHNGETGFCVLRVKAKGKKDLITVVSHVPFVSAGEFVEAQGQWVHDKHHGLQFKAEFLESTAPTTLEGIEKYLGSGLIKGIGPVYAKKLVDIFKEGVFEVIEENPENLRQVPGIGPVRVKKITKGWADQKIIRDIMLFLHSYGISTTRAVRIYKIYGSEAVKIISENPYRLAKDIPGIGFISADKIAEKLGIEKTSLIRARAGINYALSTAMNDGHCGLPKEELIQLCETLLEIPRDLIQKALDLELSEENVLQEPIKDVATKEVVNCIFMSGLVYAERNIAEMLRVLKIGTFPWQNINAVAAIEWVEEKTKLKLSESQKRAVECALSSKVLIITGGPGVGKTTLVHSILQIIQAKKLRIILAAPTGRAAKRLSESTGLEAKTIHRLLETNFASGKFTKNEEHPLACDLLVVDEASMIDVPLMNSLLKAIPPSSGLFLVGDMDQLPSVGPGQVLEDLIVSKTIPIIRLTEIFRQAAESNIIRAAHAVNEGKMPNLNLETESDFYFLETPDPEIALSKILKLVTERIPHKFKFSPIEDIQILSPMARGVIGTRNLNVEVQKILNPPTEESLQRFGWTYGVGDKVMQIENDYDKEVYNGDLGIIRRIEREESEVTISFDDRDVIYDFGELDEIALAYATTIHKSQGSEYPVVIIPLMMQHYKMLQKKLFYTAITRGKKLVIIVGQKKALGIALKNRGGARRWSTLSTRLKESSPF